MIVLGLTGSIGMGKSTTAGLFRKHGIDVFDADAAVHDLYAGDAVAAIEAAFPGSSTDGKIDREKLGAKVLGNPAALQQLEALVHPLVAQRREAFLADARARGRPVVVLDIPLLLEKGETKVDKVILVTAPETVQKQRLAARPGMTESRLAAILARQMPDSDKRLKADFIIDTSLGLESAEQEVEAILRKVSVSP